MKTYRWQVLEEFDPKKDYGQKIPPRVRGIFSLFEKDQVYLSRNFLESNKEKIKKFVPTKTDRAIKKAVEVSFPIAVKIGIMKKIKGPNDQRISYEDFCEIPEVKYWLAQLNSSNIKNLSLPSNKIGTRGIYSYRLWSFHCWLSGKTFQFSRMIHVGDDKYEKKTENVTITGVDHFLKLYQESDKKIDFVKVIKLYLLDTKQHANRRAKTVDLDSCAIKSFFKENDSDIAYSFNAKASYKTTDSETEDRLMSLDDFMKILTTGGAKVTEKAVFLCKFHRGLDTATLVDRFNFYAFEQIAKYFGSTEHNAWDLEKRPVPVSLVRVKTDFRHTGFLDRDAIEALQKYLDERKKKTGEPMKAGQPLFLTIHNHPITKHWVERTFNQLATNAGLQRRLKGYKYMKMYISHELRDLLKSTLIACETSHDVADHCIGHMPKDSYDKQHILYDDYLRDEFCKASSKLNIFSNMSHNLKSNNHGLIDKIHSLEKKLELEKEERLTDLQKSNKKLLVAEERSKVIMEILEKIAKENPHLLAMSWDKSKPIYYPE